MKRRSVIKHIHVSGCVLLREGSKHTVYINSVNNKISAIPQHIEIKNILINKICRELEIPKI